MALSSGFGVDSNTMTDAELEVERVAILVEERELEAAGILTRAVTPSTPVLIEYALTERGRELAKVIDGLAQWADRWAVVGA